MKSGNLRAKHISDSPPVQKANREQRQEYLVASRLFTVILVVIMTIGICLLAYPSFADFWNSFHQAREVMTYAEKVANMGTLEYEEILDEARIYNANIAKKGIKWGFLEEDKEEYNRQLNIGGNGVMGYIKIQKIGIMLPIYHGTSEEVLQTSIGHLEESSLPVGGATSHCMLSGHRGLPSAKLFSDLDKLKEGDTFTMTILNETLTYEIDHVWIVEPDDLTHLQLETGKDYCTLITCTPYGINTHRLLVRGHRIDNIDGNAMVTADAIQIEAIYIAPFLMMPLLLILIIYVIVSTGMKRRNRRDLKAEYLQEHGVKDIVIEIADTDIIANTLKSFMARRKRK